VADIAIRGVTKSYDGTLRAVDAVDLDVADGELLVLVGPSGCGKSTLLRMIAGLEEVTDGTIAIGGDDVTAVEPKDRDVAMVFQSYALYPHMSVARNIGYPLKLAKRPKDEIARRVAEVAEVLQLTDVLDRRPSQLSGGQRQRVAMGRAIIRHPRVFLMDEPLSNLDAKLRVEMRAEIARLQRELAVTTVYVTHDQTEAMTMGTRVAVLRDGILQQVDTPQRLYDEPVNQFVATFIGSPAMNLLAGTVEVADGGEVALRLGPERLALDDTVVAAHPVLRSLSGRRVAVGIRPEAFADVTTEPGTPADRVLEATVDLVESLGAETMVHVALPDPTAVSPPGAEVDVAVSGVATPGGGVRSSDAPAGGEVDVTPSGAATPGGGVLRSGSPLPADVAPSDGPGPGGGLRPDGAGVDGQAPGEGVSPSWRQVLGRAGRGVVRLGPRSGLAAGDVIKLAVDTTRVHLFDADTGQSLRA
jgi:multiple sugar transport system ATP-binding protein